MIIPQEAQITIHMAQISVRYYGILRELVGKREENLSVEDTSSVVDLIKVLSSRHGRKFNDFVFDQKGRIRNGLAFAINGNSVSKSKLSSTRCKMVSEFVILPPISGG